MINSNKGCFWTDRLVFAGSTAKRLTVTKVVFELYIACNISSYLTWLTVTKVVFELSMIYAVNIP